MTIRHNLENINHDINDIVKVFLILVHLNIVSITMSRLQLIFNFSAMLSILFLNFYLLFLPN